MFKIDRDLEYLQFYNAQIQLFKGLYAVKYHTETKFGKLLLLY